MLYTRQGSEVAGSKIKYTEKGKPYTLVRKVCGRCGGLGGSSAWNHTGWTCYQCGGAGHLGNESLPLYTKEKLEALDAALAKSRAKKEAAYAAKQAALEAERATVYAAYREANADLFAGIDEFASASTFLDSMREAAYRWGSLTDGQVAASIKIIEGLRAKALEANDWAGSVGEVIELSLTVKRIIDLSYGQFPTIYRYRWIMQAEDGRKVSYVGNPAVFLGEGETAVIRGKIKELEEYKGVKTTRIERPKVVSAIVSSSK